MWEDPQLFQDLLPIQSITMSSGSGPKPQAQSQAPAWRPVKAFPPDKCVLLSVPHGELPAKRVVCRYIAGAVLTVSHGLSRLPMVA